MPVTRRTFLRAGFGVSAAATVGGGLCAEFSSPGSIQVNRIGLKLRRLPEALDGLTVALISDLHMSEYVSAKHIQTAVDMVNQLRPSMVAIVGDFVSSGASSSAKDAAYIEPCSGILKGLHAPLGCFAVLGNHDHETDPVRISRTLEESGIQVLANRSLPIEHQDSRVWMAGVDDALAKKCDFDCSLAGVPHDEPVVLLAHEPDIVDRGIHHNIDLQLSGHTHGGQVRFPGLGIPYLPVLGRKYPEGLYHVGNAQLYTSRGIGVSGVPFRFACPPEITLIQLQSIGSAEKEPRLQSSL